MAISKLENLKMRAHRSINTGQWAQAKDQLGALCKKFPRDFDAWYLMGAVCGQTNDIEMALQASKKAVSIQPNNAGALYNYGMALTKLGMIDDAIKAYKKSLDIDSSNARAHYNLGNVLKDKAEYDEAIQHLEKSLSLDPRKADALFSLGCIYLELEKFTEAKSCLDKSVQLDPGLKTKVDYFIAFIEGQSGAGIDANIHVKDLHDKHASYFDNHLVDRLEYKVPYIMFTEYMRATAADAAAKAVLDLGCGTGLCGIEFKSIAKNIIGVDLSPKMLERAAALKIYDELVTSDIVEFLSASKTRFDLILAGDVFIYVGALDQVLPLCSRALNTNGFMAFSVEHIENHDYKLRISGRYAHSMSYIERLASLSGFKCVSALDITVRKELNQGISGKVVLLQKL